jgi:hypothetical protein
MEFEIRFEFPPKLSAQITKLENEFISTQIIKNLCLTHQLKSTTQIIKSDYKIKSLNALFKRQLLLEEENNPCYYNLAKKVFVVLSVGVTHLAIKILLLMLFVGCNGRWRIPVI